MFLVYFWFVEVSKQVVCWRSFKTKQTQLGRGHYLFPICSYSMKSCTWPFCSNKCAILINCFWHLFHFTWYCPCNSDSLLYVKTTSLFHFPSVGGGIDSLTNKTYKNKSQKQIEKQSTRLTKEEMPLMNMERDACKTERKLSRGLTNWRNRITVRVTLKLCTWRALNCARVLAGAAAC